MASRNDRKQAKPAKKGSKAPGKARAGTQALKTAKKSAKQSGKKLAKAAAAKSTAKPKVAARRSSVRGLVEVGVAEFLGTRYRVFTKPPQRLQRMLRFDRRDKAEIVVRISDTIEWLAPSRKLFRIQFTGQPPNLERPGERSFPSTLESGKQRAEVTVVGHPPGTRLDYDIYSPPDAEKPLDPSLIIYPNAELYLKLA
jgi:hypothetical protein